VLEQEHITHAVERGLAAFRAPDGGARRDSIKSATTARAASTSARDARAIVHLHPAAPRAPAARLGM